MFQKISSYIKESQVELKKVTWPTREETIRYTIIVIGLSLVVAFYLGGLDYIFQSILNRFI